MKETYGELKAMAKIMVLVPNEEMERCTRTVIKEENIESCDVQVIQTGDAVQHARNAIESGTTVIVARGLQADLIKKYTKIPLVEVVLTGQEIALLIQEAKKRIPDEVQKIAFIGHRTMFPDTRYINDIFQIDMRIYEFDDRVTVEEIVKQAVLDGAQMIIGGDCVLEYAKTYPVQTMFLNAKEDSMRNALNVARKVVYTSQIEKENQAQFVTVLDTVYNGVIRVDTNKIIRNVNHAAELILEQNEKHLIGKQVHKVLKDLEDDYLECILNGERDVLNTCSAIGEHNYMISIAPICVDSRIIGSIISINKLQHIAHNKQNELKDKFLSGYSTDSGFHKIYTKNDKMKRCIELARIYALSKSPIIIYGETGTEKELFAQGIHNASMHKNSPYITVNCSGMTEEQQIQLLFGDAERQGAFEQAESGTLVIRDIDELCPRCQYRLLRILRYKMFMKTDIEMTPAFDIRIIGITRRELGGKVLKGSFREDLYYLFNTFSIHVPPLRERQEDMVHLVTDYMNRYNRKYARRVSLIQGGMDAVCRARWEGNALQLEKFCERVVLTAPKRKVDEIFIHQMLEELYPVNQKKEESKTSLMMKDSPEAEKIRACLVNNNGSRQLTAKELGISSATLWRKMKKYEIGEEI